MRTVLLFCNANTQVTLYKPLYGFKDDSKIKSIKTLLCCRILAEEPLNSCASWFHIIWIGFSHALDSEQWNELWGGLPQWFAYGLSLVHLEIKNQWEWNGIDSKNVLNTKDNLIGKLKTQFALKRSRINFPIYSLSAITPFLLSKGKNKTKIKFKYCLISIPVKFN